MINNCVYDEFRKLPPADMVVVSIHDKVKGNNNSSKNTSELQDFISAPTTPEDELIAKETLQEIFAAAQAEVLEEIARLANKPAEVFVHMCSKHLNMKPAAIAELLFKNGPAASFATMLMSISNKFNIPLDEIRSHLGHKVITEASVKLDTNDESDVRAQVSRLAYRASKRLKK